MSMDGLLSEAGSSELDGLIADIIEEEEVDDAPELTDTLPSSEEEAPKAGTVELENHDDVEDDFNFSEESFLDDEDEEKKKILKNSMKISLMNSVATKIPLPKLKK